MLLLVCCVSGCPSNRRSDRAASASRKARQGLSQQTALLNSLHDKIASLHEEAAVELSPPMVALDSRSTLDGQDMMAVLLKRPDAPDEMANRILVPRGNCRFRGNVYAGDILKYYVRPDRETMERFNETGEADLANYEAVDFRVAQVLADNILLIEGGTPQPITTPAKMEIWRISDDRMNEIERSLGEYVSRRKPPLGWRPSPDQSAIENLTERLNQWLRQSSLAGKKADAGDWRRPELLETLPQSLLGDERLAAQIDRTALATGYFEPYETRYLQAAKWRRDIAAWARGGATSPTDVATALLDWLTRNVQLVTKQDIPPRMDWEMLLHGQATAEGIAWLLVGLCEQQGLQTVVVTAPIGEGESYPLVGVLEADQLRLFDPALGLPIPGANQQAVASLAEVQANDELLRSLDLPDHPYPLTAEILQQAIVELVATPFSLSRRAAEFQATLPGSKRMRLATPVDEMATRIREVAGFGEVVLWSEPFQTLVEKFTIKPSGRRQAVREFLPFAWRPLLWKGRVHQFRGAEGTGKQGELATADTASDHLLARQFYMNRGVRPSEDRLAQIPEEKRDVYRESKALATLFLGQLGYDSGAYKTARRWFDESVLAEDYSSAHRPAVDYNRGRVLEQLGEIDEAIAAYKAVQGPMQSGARLRAERLRESAADPSPPVEAE